MIKKIIGSILIFPFAILMIYMLIVLPAKVLLSNFMPIIFNDNEEFLGVLILTFEIVSLIVGLAALGIDLIKKK